MSYVRRQAFLAAHSVAPPLVQRVQSIIASIGFKDELASSGEALSTEAAVVQDADR